MEFFGIVRQRTGARHADCQFESATITLGDVMGQLAIRFPALAGECIENSRLKSSFAANVGGERFVSDPATVLQDGCQLLILSADAGG